MSKFKDTLESKSYLKYLESKHSNKYGNSSFWMDDLVTRKEDAADKFDLIKMAQYQRAISNFVKIVSRKDIPVKFNSNDTSYTDGKTEVVISGNVNEKSFDATAGLALHESSHIVYTDFDLLPKYFRPYVHAVSDMFNGQMYQGLKDKMTAWAPFIANNLDKVDELKGMNQDLIFGLSNWIEDRRIDNLVFKSSPGYKSYYHTLYEKYYLNDAMTKMLKSSEYREENVESYKARIMGLINPASDRNALVGLRNIINLIDLHNIDRLKNTEDALELSFRVADLIAQYCLKYKDENQSQPSQCQSQPQPQAGQGGDQPQAGAGNGGNNEPKDGDGNPDDDGEGTDGSQPTASNGDGPMSLKDINKVQKVLEDIEQLVQGKPKKTKLTAHNNRIVKSIAGNVDTSVDTINFQGQNIPILHVRLSPNMIRNYIDGAPVSHCIDSEFAEHLKVGNHWSVLPPSVKSGSWRAGHYTERGNLIKKGLALGTQLGKKLQVRDQVRDTRFNRLKHGKIDSRLLHQCGYDVLNIFEQVKIDKYTPSVLDISVDASSSMNGSKWNNTQVAILAIAKAASMIQNLRVKVSYRYNPRIGKQDGVMFLDAYDSNRDKIKHMEDVVYVLRPDNCTVDSLVTAYQLKKKLITPGSTEVKSYFLNFSDGAPGANAGTIHYGGYDAHKHIGKCRRDIEALGVKVMSYFIGESTNDHTRMQFIEDWGVQNAAFISVTEVLPLAKSLNNMFLSK